MLTCHTMVIAFNQLQNNPVNHCKTSISVIICSMGKMVHFHKGNEIIRYIIILLGDSLFPFRPRVKEQDLWECHAGSHGVIRAHAAHNSYSLDVKASQGLRRISLDCPWDLIMKILVNGCYCLCDNMVERIGYTGHMAAIMAWVKHATSDMQILSCTSKSKTLLKAYFK